MRRRPLEPVEIICPTCGLIAELYRPKGSKRPRFCDCPAPEQVKPSTQPRHCMSCPTRLNRYNPGPECNACLKARHAGRTIA